MLAAQAVRARAAGGSSLRHVVPNIMPQLVTFSLLGIGVVIILEGALELPRPRHPAARAELGQHDRARAGRSCRLQPEYVLIPSAFLFVTVVALNLLGDALRERWAR